MTLADKPQVGTVILYRCCNDGEQQAGTVISREFGRPGLVQVQLSHRHPSGAPSSQVFAFVDVTDPRRDVQLAGSEITRTDAQGTRWLLVTHDDEQPVHAGRELSDDERDRFRVLDLPVPADDPRAQMGDTVMIQWLTMGGGAVIKGPQPWNPYALGLDWIEQPAALPPVVHNGPGCICPDVWARRIVVEPGRTIGCGCGAKFTAELPPVPADAEPAQQQADDSADLLDRVLGPIAWQLMVQVYNDGPGKWATLARSSVTSTLTAAQEAAALAERQQVVPAGTLPGDWRIVCRSAGSLMGVRLYGNGEREIVQGNRVLGAAVKPR